MARYIDADALIKKIFPYDLVDEKCYSINAKAVHEEIKKAPTADVILRSELAVHSVQDAATILNLQESNKKLEAEVDRLKYNLKAVLEERAEEKADVAREIFAEIENTINNELKNHSKVLPQYEISNVLWNRLSGKINALQGIGDFIAELKKKYTEGEG